MNSWAGSALAPYDSAMAEWWCRELQNHEVALRVDDLIKDAVVLIGSLGSSGNFVPLGTGFVVGNYIEGRAYLNIATASHVIRGVPKESIRVRINTHSKTAELVEAPIWHDHPDENVDCSINPAIINREYFAFKIFESKSDLILTPDKLMEADIGIGDDTFVVGMFISRIGDRRNIPIVRGGLIAAMPEEPVKTQYGEHHAYLVETRSFDGLSGSPVFVQPQPLRYVNVAADDNNRRRSEIQMSKWSHHLMGMLLGTHLVSNPTDQVEILPEHEARAKDESAMLNTGIGIVLPFSYIVEAIEQPAITELRMEANREKSKTRRYKATSAVAVADAGKGVENPDHREHFSQLLETAVQGKRPNEKT